MRASLLVVLAACHVPEDVPRTVWPAPLLWAEAGVDFPSLVERLRLHHIPILDLWSGHGIRIRVPYEKHAEAVSVLKASPLAPRLKFCTIEAGPRPGRLTPAVIRRGLTNWPLIGSFRCGSLQPTEIMESIHRDGLEAGLVNCPWTPEETAIFAPPDQAKRVRETLEAGPFGDRLVLAR